MELFFAFNRMGLHGMLAGGMVLLKAAALALILAALPGTLELGVGLNAIYVVLYGISFAIVHSLLSKRARP